MRRNAIGLLGIALVAFTLACSADAPAPTPPNGGGGTPRITPGAASPLQIRLFTSNANPTAGNCSLVQAIVSLNGANVPDGTGVAFSTDFGVFQQNGQSVVSVTTQNSAAVTAICSASAGLANVRASATVAGQTGSATIAISFQPSAQSAPFFSSCSPSFASNAGGDTVTLNGGRFFGSPATTRVTFTAAGVTREALVTDLTATSVTVRTPAFPEAISPSVPVTMTLTLGTNTASPVVLTIPNCFAFGTAAGNVPTITAILPATGTKSGNTRVTIVGSGFSAPLQVFFGGVEAQVLSISYNQIIVLTPPVIAGGPVTVGTPIDVRVHEVTSGTDGILAGAYRYTTPLAITSVGANEQRVDNPFQQVTIFGQGFESPVAVSLAGITATVISVSSTEILVLPGNPALSACTDLSGPVTVTNINTGETVSGSVFRYLVQQTGPVITGVSPGAGTANSVITITGGNFAGSGSTGSGRVISVSIGGRGASFTVLSDKRRRAPSCTSRPALLRSRAAWPRRRQGPGKSWNVSLRLRFTGEPAALRRGGGFASPPRG
ncbi:MAG: IPT/TIG domain-containing protein [Acidobacteria bacterium]|nr:IPT/TIG domain-containing protein [Acidobacteriota bacterium]